VRAGFEEPTKSMFLQALAAAYAETKDPGIRAMFRMRPTSVVGRKAKLVPNIGNSGLEES